MARFKCCNVQALKGMGPPIWINLDLVKTIEPDRIGGGSLISFLGKEGGEFVSQCPESIFAGPTIDA